MSWIFRCRSGLSYVPGSATGPGTVFSLSVDGGASFELESDLGDDAARASHLRWTFDAMLYPRTTGIVSFRAGPLPPRRHRRMCCRPLPMRGRAIGREPVRAMARVCDAGRYHAPAEDAGSGPAAEARAATDKAGTARPTVLIRGRICNNPGA